MNKIVYGTHTFTDHEIESGNLHLVTNLISAQLEANALTAVVRSNDTSMTNFERNEKLTLFTDEKQTGIFYVQSINRVGSNKYQIDATSAVGLLIEGQHMGGIYTGETANEVIASICGTVPFIVKTNLVSTKLYGWLPIASPRDNLSQVLFAIGAALKTDMDGVLRIAGLWDGVSSVTPQNRMYENGKVEYGAKVTQIILTEHQYFEGQEEKKLFEGTAQEGDVITFNAPMHSLSATGISILSSGANWAKVSAGSGTLTGKEYIHNTRLITRDVQTANTPNVKTVDKATLVSLVNSSAVSDRLVSYFKCQETINAPVVYHGEDTGNIMSTYHPFDGSNVNSCLKSADITLSNTLKAQEKRLVGFSPIQQEVEEIFEYQEIITQSGTWTVPDGTTRIRAVLIGGGQGGQGGFNGKSGSSGTSVSMSSGQTGNKYGRAGSGGAGGEAGASGSGGNVMIVDLIVNAGEVISLSIGLGGAGGSGNGGSGSLGENTTLSVNGDTYSSSEGSPAAFGYTDQLSGKTYAKQGLKGIAGGSGGGGATSGVAAEDGTGVGVFSGGLMGTSNVYSSSSVVGVGDLESVYKKQLPNGSTWVGSSGGTATGYEGYSVGSDGIITGTGSQKTIKTGYTSGNVDGIVYTISNESKPSDSSGKYYADSYAYAKATGNKIYAQSDILYGRVEYHASRFYKKNEVKITKGTFIGGGGGAANGKSGGYGTTSGGKGADAITSDLMQLPGCGGHGGNGGGGGGGGGAGVVEIKLNSGTASGLSYSAYGYGASGGTGGLGSSGGDGIDGVAILYYGISRKIQAGRFVDKNGKQFLEKFTRRFIV